MRFGPQPGTFRLRGRSARTKELLVDNAKSKHKTPRSAIGRFGLVESISLIILLSFWAAAFASGYPTTFQGSDPVVVQIEDSLITVDAESGLPSETALFGVISSEPSAILSALDDANIRSAGSQPDAGSPVGSDVSSTIPAPVDVANAPAKPSASESERKAEDSRPAPSARSGREPNVEPAPPTKQLTMQEGFIALIKEPAQATQLETGVPASVSMAQAMLESDWGRSGLSRNAKNFFGIKATNKVGTAGVVYMDTWEVLNGKNVTVKAPFRAYNNMVESFVDHALYFVENSRYATAMKNIGDARQFARLIHKAGYATDPGYSDKLIALMDRYNLYSYDLPPK